MTITRLDMEAFGPFAEAVSLDFSPVAQSGLFLIHGPTGSGKTSILDAICFALYGASSGDERKAIDLRSHHAPEDRQTQVRLDFTLNGQSYRVRRWMSARRVVNFVEKAVLENMDGEGRILADKRAEVNALVQSLIKLDANQFRQVMVLPQGRFRDFLVAGSNVREGILQSLFDTARLERFAELLNQRRQNEQEELNAMQARQSILLAESGLAELADLPAWLAGIETDSEQAQLSHQRCRVASQQARLALDEARSIATLFQELHRTEEKVQHLEAASLSWAELGQRLERAERIAGIMHLHSEQHKRRDDATRVESELASARDGLARLQQSLDSARRDAAEASQAQAQVARRQEQLGQRKALLGALQELASQDQEGERGRLESAQLSERIDQAEQDLAETRAKLNRLQAEMEQEQAWLRYQSRLESLARHLDRRDELQVQREQYRQDAAREQTLVEHHAHELRGLGEQIEQLQHLLEEARQHSILAEASHLAGLLQEGQACPVCGSREHPQPAASATHDLHKLEELSAEINSQADRLKSSELQLQLHKERLDRAQSGERAIQGDLEALSAAIQNEYSGLASKRDEPALPPALAEYVAADPDRVNLTPLLERCQNASRSLPQLEKQLRAHEANRESQTASLLASQARKTAIDDSLINLDQRLDASRQRLRAAFELEDGKLPEAENLQRLIESNQVWIERTSAANRTIQDRLSSLERENAIMASRIRDLEASREKAAQERDVAASAWQKAITDHQFRTEAEALAAQMDQNRLTESRKRLEAYQRELEIARARRDDARTRLGERPEIRLDPLIEAFEAAEAQELRAGQESARLQHQLERARDLDIQIGKIAQDSAVRSQRLFSLTALSRLVAGLDASGNYVNLQRYALSVYLDEVLVAANQHLREMTRGRYELVREDFTLGKKRTGGLELYVQDTLTGLQRATESLSGGESFLSALSLALGLSAVVHARSGGVRLDTLFVDEGFGSLDEDSLQDAMQVLGRIHEKGRTIGIISHVRELKERIPTRLVVEKGPSGSSVSWDR